MADTLTELEIMAVEAAGGPKEGLTPAELHGATVGTAAAVPGHFDLSGLVELLGADVLADGEAVERFVAATLDALYASDMSFALLLPEDEAPMADRLSELAVWCQSFLAGFFAGRRTQQESDQDGDVLATLPEGVREIVEDFAVIAQLDTESAEDDSEADFVELEEYVKVGTLLIMSREVDADDSED